MEVSFFIKPLTLKSFSSVLLWTKLLLYQLPWMAGAALKMIPIILATTKRRSIKTAPNIWEQLERLLTYQLSRDPISRLLSASLLVIIRGHLLATGPRSSIYFAISAVLKT